MAETYVLADALSEASDILDPRQDWPGDRVVGLRLHIGALRALVQAGERLQRMLLYPSERCEFATENDPHDPVEYSDAEGNPLCGACHADSEAYWLTLPICHACHGMPGDSECELCEGQGRIDLTPSRARSKPARRREMSERIFDLRPNRTPEAVCVIPDGPLAGRYEKFGAVWFSVTDLSVSVVGHPLHHALDRLAAVERDRKQGQRDYAALLERYYTLQNENAAVERKLAAHVEALAACGVRICNDDDPPSWTLDTESDAVGFDSISEIVSHIVSIRVRDALAEKTSAGTVSERTAIIHAAEDWEAYIEECVSAGKKCDPDIWVGRANKMLDAVRAYRAALTAARAAGGARQRCGDCDACMMGASCPRVEVAA